MYTLELDEEELLHIQLALLMYSGELVIEKYDVPQTPENLQYLDRQRFINCSLATQVYNLRQQ